MTTKMTKRKRKMVRREEAKRTRARTIRARTDRRLKMEESRTEAKKKTAKRTTRKNRTDHFRPKCALFGEKKHVTLTAFHYVHKMFHHHHTCSGHHHHRQLKRLMQQSNWMSKWYWKSFTTKTCQLFHVGVCECYRVTSDQSLDGKQLLHVVCLFLG